MKKIVLIIISVLVLKAGKANLSKDYILLTGTISNASGEKFELVHKDVKGRFSIQTHFRRERNGKYGCTYRPGS